MPNWMSALALSIESCTPPEVPKLYGISRMIMSLVDCTPLLHHVRPLRCPVFGFAWIQLITDPEFVAGMMDGGLSQSYATLLLDFTAAVAYLVGCMEQRVFQTVYKAYLRWIAVIGHDYPDFVCEIQMELVALLPADLIQLRNVILSVCPSNLAYISPLTPDLKIDHIPYVQDIRLPLLSDRRDGDAERWVRRMIKGEIVEVDDFRNSKVYEIPRIVNRAFELGQMELVKGPFVGSAVFTGLCEVIRNAALDIAVMFIDSFIDQLRFPCRNTHFFCKLLLEMFKRGLATKDGESVSEAIVVRIVRRASILAPFPWGLKVVIVELMGNPEFGFWEMNCVGMNDRVMKLMKAIQIVVYSE
jgi:CCR4-NOT transcription complex subunit 1